MTTEYTTFSNFLSNITTTKKKGGNAQMSNMTMAAIKMSHVTR